MDERTDEKQQQKKGSQQLVWGSNQKGLENWACVDCDDSTETYLRNYASDSECRDCHKGKGICQHMSMKTRCWHIQNGTLKTRTESREAREARLSEKQNSKQQSGNVQNADGQLGAQGVPKTTTDDFHRQLVEDFLAKKITEEEMAEFKLAGPQPKSAGSEVKGESAATGVGSPAGAAFGVSPKPNEGELRRRLNKQKAILKMHESDEAIAEQNKQHIQQFK